MTTDTRIYVACLASYNNGVLHGAWIDTEGKDADDLQAEVNAILRASKFPNVTVTCPTCDGDSAVRAVIELGRKNTAHEACDCNGRGEVPSAEEFAIHDHEGFYGLISENSSLSTVAEASALIAEHGEAYAKYAAHVGGSSLPDASDFEDHFRGEWDSLEAYADDYIKSCGLLDSMPENLRYYFDTKSFARDMEINGDVFTESLSNGNVAVFSN